MGTQVNMTVYYENNASFNYNLETEFGLHLTGYSYTPPEARTEYVSVPGRDGDLDFTEALFGSNGTVHYGNAKLEMTFLFTGDSLSVSHLMQVAGMHGHRVQVHIPDGFLASLLLYGRVSVGDIESAMPWGHITMTVNVESRSNYT